MYALKSYQILKGTIIPTHLSTPSTHSSMKVKDRVWSPSPHISNLSVDVRAFLQNAAGAFSLPPMQYALHVEAIMIEQKQGTISSLFQVKNSTFPCSKGTIYVMESSNTTLNSKIFGVVLAQLFSCKFLQTISILRLCTNIEN